MVSIGVLAPALLVFSWWAYQRPSQATALLTFLIPTFLLRTQIFGWPTNFFELGVIILFTVSLFHSSRRRQWREELKILPNRLTAAVSLFLFSAVLATLVSAEIKVSLGILKGWFVIPLLFAWLAYTHPQPRDLLKALLASGAAMTVFAWLLTPFGKRAQGLYDVPNSLALWLVPLTVISVWWAVRQKNIWPWGLSFLLLSGVLLTQSVGAVLTLLITLLVAVWLFSTPAIKPKLLLLFLIIGLIGGTTLWASGKVNYLIGMEKGQTEYTSASVRWQLWSVSFDLIKGSPFLGLGLGQFEPHYQEVLKFRSLAGEKIIPEFVLRDPHNWLFSFWLNLGILGLLSFIYLNILALFSPGKNETGQAVKLALISLLVFGLVETIYWKNDLATLHWLLLALLIKQAAFKREVHLPGKQTADLKY